MHWKTVLNITEELLLSRCYVGPARTQWRKCSDKYFPYIHNIIDRFDHIPIKPHLPLSPKPWHPPGPPYRPGARPNRPPGPPLKPLPKPSLDEYEAEFDQQFLEPPKPGKIVSTYKINFNVSSRNRKFTKLKHNITCKNIIRIIFICLYFHWSFEIIFQSFTLSNYIF